MENIVSLKNIIVEFEDGDRILKDISLDIKDKEFVTFLGPSGCGKTTTLRIIAGFLEPKSGDVIFEGKRINGMPPHKRNVNTVFQRYALFPHLNVYENIAFGRLDATKEEVYEAARLAGIADYIESLPDGYDTEVGERGVRLSGGQKQRIAIARVFLKNPPILILDEATSALDNVTENMICESLNKLSEGRTTIVVAHRLSTVKSADKIIVMTDEGISETGTHEELLSSGGIYKTLFESQFKK